MIIVAASSNIYIDVQNDSFKLGDIREMHF